MNRLENLQKNPSGDKIKLQGETLPKVSVIIPVKNEAARIKECLNRLVEQTYPKEKLEILVVDGMSDDGTREIVRKFIEKENGIAEFVLVDNRTGQRTAGMNIGIQKSTGEVIVRIDARTRVPSDYISKCVNTLIETGAENVGGVIKPESSLPTQEAIGLAMSHPFGAGNAEFRLGRKSGYVDSIYLGCFRRGVFEKVGLFDEKEAVLSEDSDINYRIRKNGGKVYLNKEIAAYYQPRETFKDLWKLYFRYGGARAGNILKYKQITSWRHLVPPVFVLTLIALFAFSIFSKKCLIFGLLLLSFYLLLDFFFSISIVINQEKKINILPRVFTAFPIIHFAWTFGFFRRLFQRPKPGCYWSY